MNEIEPILDDNDRLNDNYNYWVSKWHPLIEPSKELCEILDKIPTTHTFGMEESYRRKPYIDILFKQKALLSKNYRVKSKLYLKGEKPKKHGYGHILSDFVFAFLGIHDHFFSMNKELKIPTPAFGVFIPKKLDTLSYTNATRGDLSSLKSKEPEKEFFKPEDARKYCAYKIANDHSSNFDDYWGNLKSFKNKSKYKSENWRWQIEFHYRDKVESREFDAILWPIQKIYVSETESSQIDPDRLDEIKRFKKSNPEVVIYLYEWSPYFPSSCFSLASYIITEYFQEHLGYLNNDNFSIRYSKLIES